MPKKQIYIGHSSDIDFQTELYEPIRNADFYKNHSFIFPHDQGTIINNPKELYAAVDVFVAEVSEPSTGLGIELGWCQAAGTKIVCIHKRDKQPSSALTAVCSDFRSYSTQEEMICAIEEILR